MLGKKTLLIDSDSQSNATISFGIDRKSFNQDIYHMLIGEANIEDVTIGTKIENLFLVPSTIDLVGFEKKYYSLNDKEYILKNTLDEVKNQYDFIIIDTPPTLGPVALNALVASNSIIIPIQCEYFALDGLSQLLKTVKLVRQQLNVDLKIRGFLPTMFSTATNLSKQVYDEVVKNFSSHMFDFKNDFIVIPRNVSLSEAPSFGEPIAIYKKSSPGNKAYHNLAQYIIDNNG